MLLHEHYVNEVIEKVIERLKQDQELGIQSPSQAACPRSSDGIYSDAESAIAAAKNAFLELQKTPQAVRERMLQGIRNVTIENLEYLSRLAVEETGMGRIEDKIAKNRLAAERTPGIEDLETHAQSGDGGLTIEEFAPFGLIGSIIPSTNPTETVINNGISMLAAGNTVIFNPHPNARDCSLTTIRLLNEVIEKNGGPADCFVSVANPSIETAQMIMNHPAINLLVVTGAEAVVHAAMQTGKKVIGAGPGNPPSVVDSTADIPKAARDIVRGASLDNNIICIDEKVTVAVDSITDELIREMEKAGGYVASANQIRQLQELLFIDTPIPRAHSAVEKKFVGRDAKKLLEAIGTRAADDPRLIICEVDEDHPFAWTEMLMPVMPVVRMPDVDAAIDYAVEVEQGNRHTASMHSKNIDKLTEMARKIHTSVFVKNGPNYAGLGFGGEGYTSYTIASPTGEGLTTARTFSRQRRCSLVGPYSIV
jgi:propionaldehyde dehydrogenase